MEQILIRKFISRGNLQWMYQRADVAVLPSEDEKPVRTYIKIGKVKTPADEFRSDKEQAQGYYITHEAECEEFVKAIIEAEVRKMKLEGKWSPEMMRFKMYQYNKLMIQAMRGE